MHIFDLKRFRRDKKITQVELARLFQCNQNFISRIENGEKPMPTDKIGILQSKYGDISSYYTEAEDAKSHNKQKKVTVSESSLDLIAAGGEAFALQLVKMMNDRLIAPYGLLLEKDKEIEKLNRHIGRLEAQLQGKGGNAHVESNAGCVDVG